MMQRKALFQFSVIALLLAACPARGDESWGIVWRGNLYKSSREALARKRPLVVFFYCGHDSETPCHCQRLRTGPLSSPEFAAYADKGVFVQACPELDDAHGNVKWLIEQLKIDRFPLVAVLKIEEGRIEEVGRVTGYFETPKFIEQFEAVFSQATKQLPAGNDDLSAPAIFRQLRSQHTELKAAETRFVQVMTEIESGSDTHEYAEAYQELASRIAGVERTLLEMRQLSTDEAQVFAAAIQQLITSYDQRLKRTASRMEEATRLGGDTTTTTRQEPSRVAAQFLSERSEALSSDKHGRLQDECATAAAAMKRRYGEL